MPRALTAGDLIAGCVEGQRSRPEVAGGPSPLGLQQPQHVQEIHGRVCGPCGQPPDQLIQFGQQSGSFVGCSASGVGGQGQSAKQTGHAR